MATVDGIITAEGLTKFYGHDRGVEDLSFSVGAGEVFGFLGPNGAGKTTTIRTMLDFIRPTSGAVRLFGLDAHHRGPEIHDRVGYLPGELALYERLTGERYLRDFAAFRGGIDLAFAQDLAARLGLDLSKRIKDLSHGNKQKVGLVQAFMHRPEPAGDGRADAGARPARATDVLRDARRGARTRDDRLPQLSRDARGRARLRPRGHHPRGAARDRLRHRRPQGAGAPADRAPLRRSRAQGRVRPAAAESAASGRMATSCPSRSRARWIP